MLKKNAVYTVRVEDLNNLGFGVAKVDGMTVFVSGAVDGDEVDARIIHVNKTYAVARTECVHTPSPHRVSPLCAVKGCGGCAYALVSYEHEKHLKEEYVRHAFRKAGLKDARFAPLLSADREREYRNKAQYAVAPDKEGKCAAGFFAAKSHRLCEAADCPLQAPEFPSIVKTVLAFCNQNGISPYNESVGKGLLRHIYLRRNTEGEVLVTLVLNGETLPGEKEFLAYITEQHPCVTGLYLNVNTLATNVICSDDYRHLWGDKHLYDTLCGVRLALSPASFYQVNHAAATLLYEKAAALADLKADDDLLDLYCGVGSIGLSMAKRVRSLVGVEIVPSAVECATQNAAQNGVQNARFLCADAGDAATLFASVKKQMGDTYRPSAVILDPPRKGSTPDLLTYLADTLCVPKILYISCNPDTLARDAKILCDLGYTMSEVTPVDLFPRTGHVESVVCLTRKSGGNQ